jgi:hypothetical protein
MARTWRSAKGSQGTWHAEVKWNDGTTERLACVHQHFSKAGHYYDPLSPEFYDTPADEDPRFAEWLDLIRAKGRVIMTKSELVRGGGYSHARRTGYIGVFDVTDITRDANGLHFRFVRRFKKAAS